MVETEEVDRADMRPPLERLESKVKYLIDIVDLLRGSVAILKRKIENIERTQEGDDR